LVLLHGFPSSSKDWRKEEKGFGLIVPDMLAYGGTSKPLDSPSIVARDIIDILDHEKVQKAIFIGHDW
ncbi:hypothetical protein BDP27DRAFT_1222502, partial [Rhodocollybia butyracea]